MTDTITEAQPQDADKAPRNSEAPSGGLAGLKLAQLKALASQLGIAGSSRMRKSDLVEAISAHQRGGAVADRKKTAPAEKTEAEKNTAPRADAQQDRADKAVTETNSTGTSAGEKNNAEKTSESNGSAEQASQDQSPRRGGRNSRSNNAEGEQERGQDEKSGQKGSEDDSEGGQSRNNGRNRRNRDRRNDDSQQGERQNNERHNDRQNNNDRASQDNDGDGEDEGRARQRNDRNDRGDRGDRDDRRNRRRNRNERNRRGRTRGPEHDDTEVTEDDQLIPIAGILDVLDNYAFVRTSGYLPGQNDVYVALAQVKKYNLRKGDVVTGSIKAPREDDKPNKRQKFNALVKVDKVNGRPAESNTDRVEFGKLVPLYPQERLRLEGGDPKAVGPRVIDLIAPIGKGQRGLIVSPPKAGKTMILQAVANAIKTNNPEVHLMMVLVDERPEEVTDMQRTVDGEVIASTFDRPADDHTTVAELAIERAKRLVELGKDVVVLLDSMTRLGRAYNQAAPASGRILSGGVDASALYPPKRFFGAARNIENGGSLTILATALVETGSKMDEVIFEEFKGTGNMELRLSRQLADKRIFPAVDVTASSTRREEALLSPEEVKIMWKLRRVLSGLDQQQGLELLMNKLKETQSNAEFLMLISKTTLGENGK